MDATTLIIWLPLGLLAGALHARLLWKGLTSPPAALIRMGLVGGCLFAAALTGGLLPAAAGWFTGLLVNAVICWRRAAP